MTSRVKELVHYPTPSIEKTTKVQSTTHLQILAVGNKVFEKELEDQKVIFEQQLISHEKNVRRQLKKEHNENIKELEKKHHENLIILKREYLEIQDKALTEEASRVRDIMRKQADVLVEKTVLDGQKKLDDALMKARDDFDLEKEKAKKTVIEAQQAITEHRLIQKNSEHLKLVDEVNEKWKLKIKNLSEQHDLEIDAMLLKQKEELSRQNKIRIDEALQKTEDTHQQQVKELNEKLQIVIKEKMDLHEDNNQLQNKVMAMHEHLQKVLNSFQRFINSAPGFSEGQADFILQNLLPAGLEEFIVS